MKRALLLTFAIVGALANAEFTCAQSVILPAPRLLTTFPMGGQIGTQVEVKVAGDNLENIESLIFSTPKITATAKTDENGKAVAGTFLVSIDAGCQPSVYDARVMSRLGISSARAFSVGTLTEIEHAEKCTTLETANRLEVNSVCNAILVNRAINHYSFSAKKGQRLLIDCAAKGIDSRMNPVVVVADASGNDLVAERRGGAIDFEVPEDADYTVKVHDLTFNGGVHYFFRLAIREVPAAAKAQRLASVRQVNSFSWPPHGLAAKAVAEEDASSDQPQPITLPCDIAGSFYPAADVDLYQFTAKKGETWWVEVASERLGRPTDPTVIVQQVKNVDGKETLTDIAELTDIPTPVKRSSNGYSYDGPPYNAGSSDVLGKVEIKEDGTYRLQISDLFGGTRNDPKNVYRMIIRKAQPDFALVAWAMHMGLRNGDRNAPSKPMALRGGATIPFDVVVVRRDGFDGEIDLQMTGLPDGVTATGLKIGAGKTIGKMLVSANQDAPRGLSMATFVGRAEIDGKMVERPCHLASMKWPVVNARSDIPAPRLVQSIPVSVGASEFAAISIAPQEDKVWEAAEGTTLKIPLSKTVRGQFSGANISLSTFGDGFERNAKFDVSLDDKASEAVVNLATLKTKPGEYTIAFYGGAVEKYRYNPDAVIAAQDAVASAKSVAATATGESKKQADADFAAAEKQLAAAERKAKPKDIVDIYVTSPVRIRVLPAEKK